jgi:tRNA dimethylallyltransferase
MPSTESSHPLSDKTYPDGMIPLVVIVGPTGVGKSEMTIQLAERFNGEIVSADSRLFYRGMDIGTAKPTIEERLRVPHHLIDVADPDDIWSLGIFQREANREIIEIGMKKHLPFLVGGTGQFIHSIIEGWNIPAVEPNPRLREALTRWAENIGPVEFHNKLSLLDPQAATAIDPSNIRRTIRALEVILSSGKRFSDQKKRGNINYNLLLLGLICPRTQLYQRIDERIERMISSGFVDEVQRLLDQGYSPELPTLTAIGYGEVVAYIQGKISLDEAILYMKRRTRVYVRRQANWFKENDPRIHWFQIGNKALDDMSEMITIWLAGIYKNITWLNSRKKNDS